MAKARLLNLYLPQRLHEKAGLGQGIFGKIAQAVQQAGWHLALQDEHAPVEGEGFHLVHNRPVTTDDTLCLRRSYIEPFYSIEASNDRWNWDVALKPFVPQPGGEWFLTYWRDRIFAGLTVRRDGHVFMPLQGKLSERRYFQAKRPLDMIAATLEAEPRRQILAALHPRETYSADDLTALRQFGPRFEISDRPSMDLLASCDYVVTENSGMALKGFFARKPAVLFAQIDFHHIARSVADLGVAAAFAEPKDPPPFAAYLVWFLRQHAISAWNDDAVVRIAQRLRDHGWPL